MHLDGISEAYARLAQIYRFRGDAITLLMNWRNQPCGNTRGTTIVPLKSVKDFGGLASFLKPESEFYLGSTNHRVRTNVIIDVGNGETVSFKQNDLCAEKVIEALNKTLRKDVPTFAGLPPGSIALNTASNSDAMSQALVATQTNLAASAHDPLKFYLGAGRPKGA